MLSSNQGESVAIDFSKHFAAVAPGMQSRERALLEHVVRWHLAASPIIQK